MVYMKDVKSIIIENFDKQDTSFIFPSEVTASFWRKKSLEESGRNAVRSERFLSWDTFKEKYFSLHQKGTPVNTIIRTLFAVSFLERNSLLNGSLLTSLVPPQYAGNSSSFKKLLISLLPEVSGLVKKIREASVPLPGMLIKDLVFINEEYTRFLTEHDFFEPGWMKADISNLRGVFYLFYPEVIEDYKEFSVELSASEHIRILSLPEVLPLPVHRFSSASIEIKWLLKRIKDLLEKGVPLDEISITLPDMAGWRDRLETMAHVRNIPLSIKGGRPIGEFPGARLFRMLSDCGKNGFNSTAMKQFLLNGAIPWKDAKTVHDLILFGIEHHCFRNYYRNGKEFDLWNEALVKAQNRALIDFYRMFKKAVRAVIQAKTFVQVRENLQLFINLFIDTENMEQDKILKEFQFALDSLNMVINAVEICGESTVKSPFDVWLSLLDEILYVPRETEGGIAVYPFRVAGGIGTRWHFIPGFSQRVSAVVKEDYSFLREDQKGYFKDSVRDFSDSFLSLYTISGENVVFSMSRESFSGPEIPPSGCMIHEAVLDFQGNVSEIQDVFDCERNFWTGKTADLSSVVPIMVEGLEKAEKSVFREKIIDYTREAVINNSLQESIRSVFFTSRGIFKVSSTMLDGFSFCPYSFFLQRVLSLRETQYEMYFKDHQLIGRLIHECFYALFQFIEGETGLFDPEESDRYHEKIPEIVHMVMSSYEKKGLKMLHPVWEETREYLLSHLAAFIQEEAKMFPFYVVESVEKEYEYVCADKQIQLEGRIDRISARDGVHCLVDYKKNYKRSLSRLNPETGMPDSFQLFFYLLLAGTDGGEITTAAYYNFTEDRYIKVFSDPPEKKSLSKEAVNEITEHMKNHVKKMRDRICSGDFSTENCTSCRFRNICRTKYTVR